MLKQLKYITEEQESKNDSIAALTSRVGITERKLASCKYNRELNMYERQEKWESNLSEIALVGVVLVTQKDNPVNQTGPSQGSGLIETVVETHAVPENFAFSLTPIQSVGLTGLRS